MGHGFGKRTGGPLKFRYVLLWTTIFFLVINGVGLWVVNKKIRPTLMQYAETETKRLAMLVINDAIREDVATNNDLSVIMTTFDEGEATGTLHFDTQKINQIQTEITDTIQTNLMDAKRGDIDELQRRAGIEIEQDDEGFVYYIKLGKATNNTFLANMGPAIPVKFKMIGEVTTDVVPDIKPYGINNAFINVAVVAKVEVSTIVPFSTDFTEVEAHIPVAMGMVQGDVPSLYNRLLPELSQ